MKTNRNRSGALTAYARDAEPEAPPSAEELNFSSARASNTHTQRRGGGGGSTSSRRRRAATRRRSHALSFRRAAGSWGRVSFVEKQTHQQKKSNLPDVTSCQTI